MDEIKIVEILNIEQLFSSKYVIPLYQRNFAWGEEQITRLLNDIFENQNSGEQQYYIGSLVVLKRRSGAFEVIDGQQRLTIMALLSYVLQFNFKTDIHYDSRPEVEVFFESLALGKPISNKESSISHFLEAKEILQSQIAKLELESHDSDFRNKFSEYIREHVCLVREVMPEDTDVASYFEIMNNRGVQLQEHEIIKGLLLEKIKDNPNLCQVCSYIWDACSQMDERIQKSFVKTFRIALFGDNYDTLTLTDESCKEQLERIQTSMSIYESTTLNRILDKSFSYEQVSDNIQNDEESPEVYREESIIDFPNFLMHVMKLYYSRVPALKDYWKDGVTLHDKYLLKTFRVISNAIIKEEIDAVKFIYRLLRCRTIFDRYIVKANIIVENDEEGREWSLLKPYMYKNGDRSQLKYSNTFGAKQDMIVKALSCIQVSHPSRYYKNYLQNILEWFLDKDGIIIQEDEYLNLLNNYIYSDLKKPELQKYIGLKSYCPDLQGTKISHSLLDYLDYILWNLKVNNCIFDEIENEQQKINSIRDFRFQYWNSVEHHYPQKRQQEFSIEDVTDFDLNCLGNVFLIGKATNSRLSDKNPKDKAVLYSSKDNLAPNRQLIYSITRENGWNKTQIINHLRFIETIYSKAEQILSIQLVP